MSLLARVDDLQNGNVVDADGLDAEFDNIVNVLNGTTTTKSILVRSNDNTNAVGRFDSLGSSNILELASSGVLKLSANVDGQLISDVATGTAPFSVASTTKVDNLNADFLDGFSSAQFGIVGSSYTVWTASWFYDIPPGATQTTETVHRVQCPDFTTTFIIEKIKISYGAGSHTSGGTLTFTIKRRNASGTLQTDIGTITLDNTNGTINVVYENDISPNITLNAGDVVYPLLTTRSGTITEQNVNIWLVGSQRIN